LLFSAAATEGIIEVAATALHEADGQAGDDRSRSGSRALLRFLEEALGAGAARVNGPAGDEDETAAATVAFSAAAVAASAPAAETGTEGVELVAVAATVAAVAVNAFAVAIVVVVVVGFVVVAEALLGLISRTLATEFLTGADCFRLGFLPPPPCDAPVVDEAAGAAATAAAAVVVAALGSEEGAGGGGGVS
jgi:hypothetical protein